MRYVGSRWRLDLPRPSLLGAHQIANAGTALACLESLPPSVMPPGALAQGLRQIEWPARLQRLTRGPLVEMMRGWELWLDGGHNPAAGEVLAASIGTWRDRPLHLVVGMLNTKDSAGFLAPLAPAARSLQAVTIPDEENPLPAAKIVEAAGSVGMAGQEASSIEAALQAIAATGDPGRVLICGSLHFAGVVLRDNG
jgi:dihydrofolate synthase/folylpolyglutamate synthase